MTPRLLHLACALALASAGAATAACAPPPAAMRPAAAEGRASIQAAAKIVAGAASARARRLQATVPVYTASDVDVVELRLYAVAGAVETLVGTAELPAGYFAMPITFSRLRANTTYRLRAKAYLPGGRTSALQISADATSYVDVVTTDDDRATWTACPVRLIDKPFDAAAVGGIDVYEGGLTDGLRGLVLTLAGSGQGFLDGQGALAQLGQPSAFTYEQNGGYYVVDAANHRIRVLDADGNVTTYAGDGTSGLVDGALASARFASPRDIDNVEGEVFVLDTGNHALRVVDEWQETVTTLAGDGTPGMVDDDGANARFNGPQGLEMDGYTALIADSGNHRIRKVASSAPYAVTTIAGGGAGAAYLDDATGTNARFANPAGLAIDGSYLYVADAGNNRIRQVDLAPPHAVTTLAGDGTAGYKDDPDGLQAQFDNPMGLAVDAGRGLLYVADAGNHRIRAISLETGRVTTVAGDATSGVADGFAGARFNAPRGLYVDDDGSLLVADAANHRVRRVR